MQHLHPTMTSDELNTFLDNGAVVVWVAPADSRDQWSAVLDHPETVNEDIVAWLQSINPSALDEAMLHGGLGVSPGQAALQTLIRLAGASPSG